MDVEEDIKKLNKYIELVIDKDYCDCNELNVIIGKHCDGSKNVAYAIKNTLAEREEDKKRIKELEEDNKRKDMFVEMAKEVIENSILKQKIKDLLTEIQEEYNEVQEQFDCIWNKKSKDDYDRYKLQEFSTMQQQLGFFIGKLEELLEEK